MVAADRRHHGAGRPVDDVGGVDPAAQADLEQQHVGGRLGEEQQGRRGGDLEDRDRLAGIHRLAAGEGLGQPLLGHEAAAADRAEADALVEAHEMGRGVDVGREPPASRIARMVAMVEPLPLVPATWITGGSRRSGCPNAASRRWIRPSDKSMVRGCSARKRAIRASEDSIKGLARRSRGGCRPGPPPVGGGARERIRGGAAPQARPLPEAGPPRPRHASRRHGLDLGLRLHLGLGRCQASAGTCISSPHRRAMVTFRSRRCTTWSTMPCSFRYSARWKPSGSFSRMVCSITRGPANPISAPARRDARRRASRRRR